MVRHLGYTVADYMETIEHLSPTWLDFIEVSFRLYLRFTVKLGQNNR